MVCLQNLARNMNVSSAQELKDLAKPVATGEIGQMVPEFVLKYMLFLH